VFYYLSILQAADVTASGLWLGGGLLVKGREASIMAAKRKRIQGVHGLISRRFIGNPSLKDGKKRNMERAEFPFFK